MCRFAMLSFRFTSCYFSFAYTLVLHPFNNFAYICCRTWNLRSIACSPVNGLSWTIIITMFNIWKFKKINFNRTKLDVIFISITLCFADRELLNKQKLLGRLDFMLFLCHCWSGLLSVIGKSFTIFFWSCKVLNKFYVFFKRCVMCGTQRLKC